MSSIIKSNRVRVDARVAAAGGAQRVGPGASQPSEACEKAVRLLEMGGRVHALELSCLCGEITIIELDYPSEARTEPEEPTTPQEDNA